MGRYGELWLRPCAAFLDRLCTGEVLPEWRPEDMTVTQAAKELQLPRVTLSKVLNGKAGVTAGMALRLSAWLRTFIADSFITLREAAITIICLNCEPALAVEARADDEIMESDRSSCLLTFLPDKVPG